MACPHLPTLDSRCSSLSCAGAEETHRNGFCADVPECFAREVRQQKGAERRHLGWRFIDALRPLHAMATELKAASAAEENAKSSTWARAMQFAASVDGVLGATPRTSSTINRVYAPILKERHEALAAAAHAAVPTERVEGLITGFIQNCSDYHLLGLSASSLAAGRAQHATTTELRHLATDHVLKTDYLDGDDAATLLPAAEDADACRTPAVPGWPRHPAANRPAS